LKVRRRDGSGEIEYRFLTEDTDRNDNVRVYFRRPGQPKVRLRSSPGTPEFDAEYRAALIGAPDLSMAQNGDRRRSAASSLAWLCKEYFASVEFHELDQRTQRVRRGILEHICERDGDKPYALLQVPHVKKMRDVKAGLPEAANGIVKALRQLYAYALETSLVQHNPAKDVKYLRSKNVSGFHSWTEDEIAKFEQRHPVGTKARLALALLIYTAQRRSDVVALGRQQVDEGRLRFRQFKNRNRKPVDLVLPIHPDLQLIIDASTCGPQEFLVTEFGKPFTSNGFGNWFRRRCDEAGLPECSAHGLRKAAAKRFAEAGFSEHEIMAWTGHRTSKEIRRYTLGADQEAMASASLQRVLDKKEIKITVPLSQSGTKRRSKSLKSSVMVPGTGIEPVTRGFSIRILARIRTGFGDFVASMLH